MRRFLFSSTTTILLTGEDLEAEEGFLWAKQAPRCWAAQLGEMRVLVSLSVATSLRFIFVKKI